LIFRMESKFHYYTGKTNCRDSEEVPGNHGFTRTNTDKKNAIARNSCEG
jgi:hypothetical protein